MSLQQLHESEMELESPTQSWDENKDAQRDNVPTYHGRRSATDLDLNLAATKDEADGDDYYSHYKEPSPNQIDMKVDGGEQQISSPLTRNISLVGSPSLPTTRSVSPVSRLSSSPLRKELSYLEDEGQAGFDVDCQPSSPGGTPTRRSLSPTRQKTLPFPRRIPLKFPAVRERSCSPGKTHVLRSPSPVRQTSTSPGGTPQRLPLAERHRSPSPVGRSSSPGRIHPRSPSPVRQISPACVRQMSPSLERTHQTLLSPLRQISNSPGRIHVRSPSPARQRSPLPRKEGSPPSAQHGSPPPRKYSPGSPLPARYSSPVRSRSPPPRKYSPHDVQERERFPSSVRHRSPSPRRRYSPQDIRRQRDRSLSRSPVRRRDVYSGSGRGYHNVSRSRSPLARDHYQRSPRGRYSPRRRTPPREFWPRRRSPRRRPWSPPPNRSTGVGKPGNNLFVAGFSFVTTERDLEKKFSRFGRVTDVRIVRDKRSGDSRGFGFLSLERDEEADAAIRALDQTEWNGRIVLVEKSKTTAR